MIFSALTSFYLIPNSLISIVSFSTISNIANSVLSAINYSVDVSTFTFVSHASIQTEPTVRFESKNVISPKDDLYTQLDSSSNFRNNLFYNPIISYDYKNGHYLGL